MRRIQVSKKSKGKKNFLTMKVAAGTPLMVRENGLTRRAVCIKMHTKNMSVRYDGEHRICSVPISATQVAKRKTMKRPYIPRAEHMPTTRRHDRYRKVHVLPVRFQYGKTYGDFGLMLRDDLYKKHGVMLYNDNWEDWEAFGMNPTRPMHPGGGNACARPMQHLGHSIGMPTGPFHSLEQRITLQFSPQQARKEVSAKEVIDEAILRIVRLFLENKDKDTLYFSVNPNDPPGSRRIGLAIFAGMVGSDVVDYISSKIDEIPSLVQKARVRGLIV